MTIYMGTVCYITILDEYLDDISIYDGKFVGLMPPEMILSHHLINYVIYCDV